MTTIEFEISNLKAGTFDELANDVADFIMTKASENLIANDSVDTGFLLRSARKEKTFGGVKIIFDCPYAEEVEMGSEPHRVPFNAIFKWAVRKLRLSEKEAQSVTWAIIKKIEKEGIRERPYVRPAVHSAQELYKI